MRLDVGTNLPCAGLTTRQDPQAVPLSNMAYQSALGTRPSPAGARKKRKENFTLFSDHNGSLLRRQPGAMTIGHSPKGKEKSST